MPDPSDEERLGRQCAVSSARANIELSGGSLSPEIDALNARYIAGDLSDREHIESLLDHARALPPGKPVQEYFTSFDDAVNMAPIR